MTSQDRDGRRPEPRPDTAEAIAEGLDGAMIHLVVQRFYDRARDDEVIGPVFRKHVADDAWSAHIDTVAAFWRAALLGDKQYAGRPMGAHLRIEDLGDRHFMRWLALFRHTVTETCPPATARLFIDRSERIAESFRVNIAMLRGDNLVFHPRLKRETYP